MFDASMCITYWVPLMSLHFALCLTIVCFYLVLPILCVSLCDVVVSMFYMFYLYYLFHSVMLL